LVNRVKLAEIFGVSVDTVTAWVKRGCPYLSGGAKGKQWSFNSASVFRWHLEAVDGPEGVTPVNYEQSKARKMAADAALAEIELDRARGAVVELAVVIDAVTEEYATVRTRLGSLPGILAPRLSPEHALEYQPLIADVVDDILKELSADERFAEADDETGDGDEGVESGSPPRAEAGSPA
tara:strand:- start:3755 stop:4294 length:540 start_codon:yes stop_codon:yes gene_type:complete